MYNQILFFILFFLLSFIFQIDGLNNAKKQAYMPQGILKCNYETKELFSKFLAKKGVWTSEFRIESGLNCGGHAFATQGDLLGPILDKFNEDREELIQEIFSTSMKAYIQANHL